VGLVMDGNRRYARRLGQPVLYGHGKGAITASNVLEWWVKYVPDTYDYPAPSRFLPKAITLWAFSSENFNRPDAERDGLLHMMAAEFRSLAHTAFIHLFRIQVKVIGSSRDQLPPELVDAIELLEESTAKYDNLFLQLAVGYGGRREIVDSVNRLLAQNGPGKEVVEISEADITRETYCGQVNIPPCQLIIRTSERRTSGFFLWDTQIAELFFIDKLWPELNEIDWLNALRSYAHREYRGGL
ncbi:undecaprenyl pyrophosphate synthase, UppS, partial [Fistulina hepatica ATCC 64428]